jgi:hypothetical protein
MQTQVKPFRVRFQYAGGHPDFATVPASAKTEIEVNETGISFHRRTSGFTIEWHEVFSMPIGTITSVRHVQQASALFHAPDQLIEVDMQRNGATYTVRFKAVGMTRQKDAYRLYAAINAIRAQGI